MEYLVKTYSNENDTILDFAMGSGTTGIACKIDGFDFVGIDMEEVHCEISRARIAHAVYEHPKPQQLDLFE